MTKTASQLRVEAARAHNAAAPRNTLLGLPQELRDHIDTFLLPKKIHVDVSLHDRRMKDSDDSKVGVVMKPCTLRAACNNLRKVSVQTSNDMRGLLKNHIEKVVIVIDVSANPSVHDTKPLRGSRRMGLDALRKVKHVEIRNCWGVDHGPVSEHEGDNFPGEIVRTIPYNSLERLALSFDRHTHEDGHPAVRVSEVAWHEYKRDEKFRNTRDQPVLQETIESILAFRLSHFLPQWTSVQGRNPYNLQYEATVTPLLLWKLQKAMAFQVDFIARVDPQAVSLNPLVLDSIQHSTTKRIQTDLKSIRHYESDADWQASCKSRLSLTEKLDADGLQTESLMLGKSVTAVMQWGA